LQGDQIFNGAIDNASGVASLIQLAAAFKKLNPPPKRSVLFMATTAEEAGLLGAKFYAEHPLYPLEKTLADINSTLDDLLAAAAKRNGQVMTPNSQPEKGGFYRADHFEFARHGVPALYTGGGKDSIGKPADFGQQKKDHYIVHHYHQPSDEVDPNWDLFGAVQDVQLFFEVGYQVANGDKFPEWKPGSEFKAKRDATLEK
jgi:Zn-dependent M28 family amino/carboxypeptidase